MRSDAGVAEIYILSKGAMDDFVVGSALPSGAVKVAGAIAANRDIDAEPYNPPKDMYGNIIRQNSKENIKILVNTLQADLDTVHYADYISSINGGADVLVIPEGYTRYEGNSAGVPTTGSGVWWLKNVNGGIYFLNQANSAYMGLDWEFRLDESTQSLNLIAEAAYTSLKYKQIHLASTTNIVKETAVALPDINKDKQYVMELTALQYHDGTTWQTLISYEDINSVNLMLKSVTNKQKKTNRSIKGLGEIDLTVISADGSPLTTRTLKTIDQFSRVRATFNNPVDGLDYYVDVLKNQVSNNTNLSIRKEARENTFKLAGQFPISKLLWYLSTTRTIQIGY